MAASVEALQNDVAVPALVAGDRLTREEFERRYAAMSSLKKAELIEGVVYMPSPVSSRHAVPHAQLIGLIAVYAVATPGTECGDNATVRLDLDNEPQPDAYLRVLPEHGGQSADSADGFVEGAPEFVAEIAASSASYDLHDKLNAYRRNGVKEYVVWRVLDRAIDWFVLRAGRYERSAPRDGCFESEVFPGLRLDADALLRGDVARALAVLRAALGSAEHRAFVERLAR